MADVSWVPFYEQMATSLYGWRDRAGDLWQAIKEMAASQPLMGYLHFDHAQTWAQRDFQIDPFTVMGIFNRGVTPAHRVELGRALAGLLGVKGSPPASFHGIPFLDPRNSVYAGNAEMWALGAAALAGDTEDRIDDSFAAAYDAAAGVRGNGRGTLTIGLFWMRPLRFMALDAISLPFIESRYGLASPPEKCSGQAYVEFLAALQERLHQETPPLSFPAVGLAAWQAAHGQGGR